MSLEQAIPVFQDLLPILTPVPAAASVPALAHNPQIILILCGLPGSGKSSFSESLAAANLAAEDVSTSPWIRASQDDAPSKKRQEVESMVRKALREGKNVVVDRVGFDSSLVVTVICNSSSARVIPVVTLVHVTEMATTSWALHVCRKSDNEHISSE